MENMLYHCATNENASMHQNAFSPSGIQDKPDLAWQHHNAGCLSTFFCTFDNIGRLIKPLWHSNYLLTLE